MSSLASEAGPTGFHLGMAGYYCWERLGVGHMSVFGDFGLFTRTLGEETMTTARADPMSFRRTS